MFVWGGNAGLLGQYHSRLDMFSVNILTGEWCQHSVTARDAPPPCDAARCAAIGDTIYSYGGEIGWAPYRTSDELYKLNLEDMRWRMVKTRGTKPEGRSGAAMCSVNGKLLLMGGAASLLSQRKHPQAQYKEAQFHHGLNNELLSLILRQVRVSINKFFATKIW